MLMDKLLLTIFGTLSHGCELKTGKLSLVSLTISPQSNSYHYAQITVSENLLDENVKAFFKWLIIILHYLATTTEKLTEVLLLSLGKSLRKPYCGFSIYEGGLQGRKKEVNF